MPAGPTAACSSATVITSRAGVAPCAPGASPESSVFSSAVFASCSSSMAARRIARAARRALRCICCEDMSDIRIERGFCSVLVSVALSGCRCVRWSDAREPVRCMCMLILPAVAGRGSAAAPQPARWQRQRQPRKLCFSASWPVGARCMCSRRSSYLPGWNERNSGPGWESNGGLLFVGLGRCTPGFSYEQATICHFATYTPPPHPPKVRPENNPRVPTWGTNLGYQPGVPTWGATGQKARRVTHA